MSSGNQLAAFQPSCTAPTNSCSLHSRKVYNFPNRIYAHHFPSVALALGAIAERGRLGPTLVFMFLWTTVVYDPIAYWTWNPNGWSAKLGILDYTLAREQLLLLS